MSPATLPQVLRSDQVRGLLAIHRAHHGLATLAPPGEDGVPVLRGGERVASLQATGPRDAVELLVGALGAILDLQEDARLRHAELGRRLSHLSQRLEHMRGEFDRSLRRQTEDLLTLNRRLVTAATTDPLTGLLNRRAIEARMKELAELVREEPTPMAVIMVDVDHFKRVNDTYGHLVGDAVLAQVAEILRGRCRASDAVGRWGGEEFVILLSGCELAPAAALAEDLRLQLERQPFHVAEGSFSVTCSFGVSAGEVGGGAALHALLAEADRRLYAAKDAGRNCVISTESAGVSKAS